MVSTIIISVWELVYTLVTLHDKVLCIIRAVSLTCIINIHDCILTYSLLHVILL